MKYRFIINKKEFCAWIFPGTTRQNIWFLIKSGTVFMDWYLLVRVLYQVTFDLCFQLGKGDRFYQYPEIRIFELCHFFIN